MDKMDTEFEVDWQKSKDKELMQLLWNKFNVLDLSNRFLFPDLSRAYNMVQVIKGKII